MQSVDKDNNVLKSIVGDMKEVSKEAFLEAQSKQVDHVTIANFNEGDRVELKGLQFKIIRVRSEKKRLVLQLL